jgi:hypothetical protein
MTNHITASHDLDRQVLDALLDALDISPDDAEYEITLEALRELEAAYDNPPPDLAERLVTEFEKTIGVGLDESQHSAAIAVVMKLLPRPIPPLPAIAPSEDGL